MTTVVRTESRIPEFDSYEEEAAFWDTHSFAEFEDELEPVTLEKFDGPVGHVLSVRLESGEFRRLTRLARGRGVSFIALAEGRVREALGREEVDERSSTRRDERAD